MISIITAMTPKQVIGVDNSLPWGRMRDDMRWFRHHTMGKMVIMGRNTFESLSGALDGRTNVVLTSDPEWEHEGVKTMNSIEAVLDLEKTMPEMEFMIIGGGSIYRQFLPYTHRLYITLVHSDVDGDTMFPLNLEEIRDRFICSHRKKLLANEVNDHAAEFMIFNQPPF